MIVIVERHEGLLREAVVDEYNSELVLSLTSHPEYGLWELLIITESHLTLLTMRSVVTWDDKYSDEPILIFWLRCPCLLFAIRKDRKLIFFYYCQLSWLWFWVWDITKFLWYSVYSGRVWMYKMSGCKTHRVHVPCSTMSGFRKSDNASSMYDQKWVLHSDWLIQ